MEGKLSKWGNSVALRIPKALLKQLSLDAGSTVEIYYKDNKLIVETKKNYNLDDLMKGITKENMHKELLTKPRGKEEW